MTIEEALLKLSASPFRSRFRLREEDKAYIRQIGIDTLRTHAADLIASRLAPAFPKNDGKQTPMKGHPVFIAQHACALCCRGCLQKWYHVPKGVPLSPVQQEKIVNLLMAWIKNQIE